MNYLTGLAHYYSELGDYAEAIRLGTEAMNIRKEVYGEKHQDMQHHLAIWPVIIQIMATTLKR